MESREHTPNSGENHVSDKLNVTGIGSGWITRYLKVNQPPGQLDAERAKRKLEAHT
jgi:hypothetical protein